MDTLNRTSLSTDDSIDNDQIDTLRELIETFKRGKANIKTCTDLFAYVESELFKRYEKLDDSLGNDAVNIGVIELASDDYHDEHIVLCYEVLIHILEFLKASHPKHDRDLPQLFTKGFITKIFSYMQTTSSSEGEKIQAFFEKYLFFPGLADDLFQFIYEILLITVTQIRNNEGIINRSAGSFCLLIRFFMKQKYCLRKITLDPFKLRRLIIRLHQLSYYSLFHNELDQLTQMFMLVYPAHMTFIVCHIIDDFMKMHQGAANIHRRIAFISELRYTMETYKGFRDHPERLQGHLALPNKVEEDLEVRNKLKSYLNPPEQKPVRTPLARLLVGASGDSFTSAADSSTLSLPPSDRPPAPLDLVEDFTTTIFPKMLEFFAENFKLRHAELMNTSIAFWCRNKDLWYENKNPNQYEQFAKKIWPCFKGTEYMIPECTLQLVIKHNLLVMRQKLAREGRISTIY